METGEQSTTHTHDLAVRAALDGRVLVIATLTAFDPSGRQMTTSIARKLRAFSVLNPRSSRRGTARRLAHPLRGRARNHRGRQRRDGRGAR
jgi:hypothetical protein